MPRIVLPVEVCAEAFPADPDFPQLRIASDSGRMLEVFRRHLKPLSGRVYELQECIPYRFRCRQSTARCVLQYTLRVVEPGAGRQWSQWVTGVLYGKPGEARRLCAELQAAIPRRGIPEAWLAFEPVDFIPDLQMLVQVFPFDRKLPNLCPVLDGAALRGLDSRLLESLGPGQWQIERRHIEPARYRTELGAALKYTVQAREPLTTRSLTQSCYLKVYRNERGQETFDLMRALAESAAADRGLFAVVRPLAYLSELRTLVLEEAVGATLQQLLLGGGDLATPMRAAARAVAAFNQADLRIGRHHSLAEQLDDLRRASSLVQWACPRSRVEVQAITAAVVAGLEEVPPAPIHRDFKIDHLFLSGDRVTFIDLDSVALGDPVRDPAHLWAHLSGGAGLAVLSAEGARLAAEVFVEEYFAQVPKAWRQRFPLHCAGALIEVAGGIFKRQEPFWPLTLPILVERAGLALTGRLW
jgi:hypothetical protein